MWEEKFEDHSMQAWLYRWIIMPPHGYIIALERCTHPAQWVTLRNIQVCFIREIWLFDCSCTCAKAVLSTIGVRRNSFGIILSMLLLHLSSHAYLSNSEQDLHVQICKDSTQQVKMNHKLWLTIEKFSCTLSLLPLEAHWIII